MNDMSHMQELSTLKMIAETLNRSHHVYNMLDAVLEKLLDVTELTFGWIFLMDENGHPTFAADRNLPPALLQDDKAPMKCGSCWCVDQYQDDRLTDAVNILSCRRLSQARAAKSGDTCGFTHHATVPLRIGERKFGILNVGAAGKNHFTAEELALLQSVAFQIGVAVERIRLHEAEQRRAEQFTRLGAFSRSLHQSVSSGMVPVQLAENAISLLAEQFDWPMAALLERTGDSRYAIQALHADKTLHNHILTAPAFLAAELSRISGESRCMELNIQQSSDTGEAPWSLASPPLSALLAVPVTPLVSQSGRFLLIRSAGPAFLNRVESEVLEAVAEHIAAAIDHARLEENRRELVRVEERNRLARDLHDSVSQMLFSISMTAKGAESYLENEDLEAARLALQDMTVVSKDALKEMRSLIMQLRPANLDGGIARAIIEYGKRLGLHIRLTCDGCMKQLPQAVEVTVWRVAQETLNNVAKHAGADTVDIALYTHDASLVYVAKDNGSGVNLEELPASGKSLGISIMRERVEAAGGQLRLASAPGEGMLIEATLPLSKFEMEGVIRGYEHTDSAR
ncbi:GAF domain-containing protein [Paenibacillus sp. 1011MAR3C5]|uniref:GAF domain-containing sensor histidine kinase n=1 Tax=Paenibacillus sp. 1011MAR3C5 TaxID=1675787 RepID=UPI000E6CBCBC|nr:GAF domain-containing sensor histidine kinase [Paenibacillus sp. 1011MAR3C5]RJE86058.1 GAF domain-containing protein [Paenibacillus sp. 1011MAR3C5]